MYKENNGRITFPDNPDVDYMTTSDIYPLRRVPFENFYVYVMNNSEKYLVNNYSDKWMENLPINKRFPHEGLIDANKTCHHHYKLYPQLYPK